MAYCWAHQAAIDPDLPTVGDDVRRLRAWITRSWAALRRRRGIELVEIIPADVVLDDRANPNDDPGGSGMSQWVNLALMCDTNGCTAEFPGRVGERLAATRRRAVDVGWDNDGNDDRCPLHVAAARLSLVGQR